MYGKESVGYTKSIMPSQESYARALPEAGIDISPSTLENIEAAARQGYEQTWLGDHSRPSRPHDNPDIYAGSWCGWDLYWATLAHARYAPERGMQDILWGLHAQWIHTDGRKPHIRFDKLRPDEIIYNPLVSRRGAPLGVLTSALIQPPIDAQAAWSLRDHLPRENRRYLFEKVYDAVTMHRRYLTRHRTDPATGLIEVYHPDESGMDNSPVFENFFDASGYAASRPVLWHVARSLHDRFRHDKALLKQNVRTSPKTGIKNAFLLASMVLNGYREEYLRHQHPLRVLDPSFNAITIREDRTYQELAADIGKPIPDDLAEAMVNTRQGLQQLWSEPDQMFMAVNQADGRQTTIPHLSGLMPLYCDALTPDQAQALIGHTQDTTTFLSPYGVLSCPSNVQDYFSYTGYWSGSIWPHTNEALATGLREHGAHDAADDLTLRLLGAMGVAKMHENIRGDTGEGVGNTPQTFSIGTAAKLIPVSRKILGLAA